MLEAVQSEDFRQVRRKKGTKEGTHLGTRKVPSLPYLSGIIFTFTIAH